MTVLATRLLFETQRSIAFGDIGASYAGIGTAIDHPARSIMILNGTDVLLQFSIDGITDHFVLGRNDRFILDITSNRTREDGFFLAEGDRVYVRRIGVPTQGSVYLSVLYGSEV